MEEELGPVVYRCGPSGYVRVLLAQSVALCAGLVILVLYLQGNSLRSGSIGGTMAALACAFLLPVVVRGWLRVLLPSWFALGRDLYRIHERGFAYSKGRGLVEVAWTDLVAVSELEDHSVIPTRWKAYSFTASFKSNVLGGIGRYRFGAFPAGHSAIRIHELVARSAPRNHP